MVQNVYSLTDWMACARLAVHNITQERSACRPYYFVVLHFVLHGVAICITEFLVSNFENENSKLIDEQSQNAIQTSDTNRILYKNMFCFIA